MKALGWYLHTEEGRAAARKRQAEWMAVLRAAEDAGVPWHYDMSTVADHGLLAEIHVSRAIGAPDPVPTDEGMERDLLAVSDFSIQPLWDFARAQRRNDELDS